MYNKMEEYTQFHLNFYSYGNSIEIGYLKITYKLFTIFMAYLFGSTNNIQSK